MSIIGKPELTEEGKRKMEAVRAGFPAVHAEKRGFCGKFLCV